MPTAANMPVAEDHVKPYSLPLMEGRVITQHGEVTTGNLPTADDISELIEQSKAEGFAVGYEEGLLQGQDEIKARVEVLEEMGKQLRAPLDAIDDEVMQSVAALAGAMAKHIVRTHLSVDPQEIMSVVRDAVEHLPLSDRRVTICLNPDDLSFVQSNFDQQDAAPPWTLQADTAVSRGGCLATTDISTVDATLETRITQIENVMLGEENTNDQ